MENRARQVTRNSPSVSSYNYSVPEFFFVPKVNLKTSRIEEERISVSAFWVHLICDFVLEQEWQDVWETRVRGRLTCAGPWRVAESRTAC